MGIVPQRAYRCERVELRIQSYGSPLLLPPLLLLLELLLPLPLLTETDVSRGKSFDSRHLPQARL
jgi:hypothetical protein